MVRKKNSFFDFKAQGTIEYLIIVAVVIVLSLIVVALVLSSSNNSTAQLIDSSAQMSNVFGGSISASELVIDSNGNALFKLNNLSGDNVTIKKIIVGGEESAYNDLVPSTGERMIFLADSNTNCVCQENQKNAVCVVEIVYVTREGLEKKETRNLTIDCVNTAAPSQPLQVSGLGSGTIDDPFVINSCKELQRMKDNLDWHYALGGDINCAETINWNNGLGFEPIGSGDNAYCEGSVQNSDCNTSESICTSGTCTLDSCVNCFGGEDPSCGGYGSWCHESQSNCLVDCSGSWQLGSTPTWHPSTISFFGSLDGKGNNITNLYINRSSSDNIGLFGYIGGGAFLKNVGLVDSNITGRNYVGGLVAYFKGGLMDNAFNSSKITGTTIVGGLVGRNSSTSSLINSYNLGEIIGSGVIDKIGGLVGQNDGNIIESYNRGNIYTNVPNTSYRVGGLVGQNFGGLIEKSFSDCNLLINSTVSNKGVYNVGGLVGATEGGQIKESYSLGNIICSLGTGGTIGGLVGNVAGSSISLTSILNSFSAVDINTPNASTVGGVFGDSSEGDYSTIIRNVYSTGNVRGKYYVAGVSGDAGSDINFSYSTGNIVGTAYVGGLSGKGSGGSFSNSFSTSPITGTSNNVAGLFGNIDGITNCAWLTSSHSIAIPSYYECVHPSCPGELFCNEWSCAEGGGELVGGSNISSLEEYGLGTDSELASEFYSRDHNVYSNWDSNWVWSESNYPILSWQ